MICPYHFQAMTSPSRLGSAMNVGRGGEMRAVSKPRSNPIRAVRSQDMAGMYQPDHQPAAISVVRYNLLVIVKYDVLIIV